MWQLFKWRELVGYIAIAVKNQLTFLTSALFYFKYFGVFIKHRHKYQIYSYGCPSVFDTEAFIAVNLIKFPQISRAFLLDKLRYAHRADWSLSMKYSARDASRIGLVVKSPIHTFDRWSNDNG